MCGCSLGLLPICSAPRRPWRRPPAAWRWRRRTPPPAPTAAGPTATRPTRHRRPSRRGASGEGGGRHGVWGEHLRAGSRRACGGGMPGSATRTLSSSSLPLAAAQRREHHPDEVLQHRRPERHHAVHQGRWLRHRRADPGRGAQQGGRPALQGTCGSARSSSASSGGSASGSPAPRCTRPADASKPGRCCGRGAVSRHRPEPPRLHPPICFAGPCSAADCAASSQPRW